MKIKAEELIKILDKYDDIAIRITASFFQRHNLPQLAERVLFWYAADFGVIKLLKHVIGELFHFKSRDIVEFYEGMYENRETPRYEDLIAAVTLILAALATIGAYVSPIIGVEYSKWREKAKHDKKYIVEADYKELLNLLKYLIKVFALRDAYFTHRISKEQFKNLKKFAGDLILEPGVRYNAGHAGELDQIWKEFEDTTKFPIDDQMCKEFAELALAEIQEPSAQFKKLTASREDRTIIFRGLGVSPGHAEGLLRVINSIDDTGKVIKGEVGVFHYCTPDMVPALKKCAATIGLERCGGRTGHLSLVSRELKIPCVVQLEKNDHFVDGKSVCVDGDTGEVIVEG
jgi:phosphohistidine swiveling domain-containing protein